MSTPPGIRAWAARGLGAHLSRKLLNETPQANEHKGNTPKETGKQKAEDRNKPNKAAGRFPKRQSRGKGGERKDESGDPKPEGRHRNNTAKRNRLSEVGRAQTKRNTGQNSRKRGRTTKQNAGKKVRRGYGANLN